jgi:hypothetical protein
MRPQLFQVPDDLRKAMASLGVPNANEARAVDARQEIDLKVAYSPPCASRLVTHNVLYMALTHLLTFATNMLAAASRGFKPNSFEVASVA